MDQDLPTTATTSGETTQSPHLFTTPSSILPDLPSLLSLARRGQYRSLLEAIQSLRLLPDLLPHHHLSLLSLSLLSLCKLRRFTDAASELDALLPHPLDSSQHLFQSHPQFYGPDLHGSMIPFALRFLHADLPQRLGKRHVTLDRLYSLLDFVRSKLHPVPISSETSSDNNSNHAVDAWRRREAFLMASLIRNHFSHREFEVTLALLTELLKRDPADPVLLSRLGYVQLQIGDVSGAGRTFKMVGDLEKKTTTESAELGNLVRRNRALERIVEKDYAAAVREYEECIERDPADVVALNNKALCLMYSRDLSDSIKVLEGALERVPTVAVNETLVVNLCSMYELAYVNHGEVKKSLGKWIAQVAPDDFDPSCTRI